MGRDDRREVGVGNLADQTDSLDAGIVDKDVDPVGPRINRLECVSDAGRFGDIGFEIDDARARVFRSQLVEREHPCAVGEQPLGDRIANAARRARHDGGPAGKRIGHCSSLLLASAQYISQPPLTLMVAPVT